MPAINLPKLSTKILRHDQDFGSLLLLAVLRLWRLGHAGGVQSGGRPSLPNQSLQALRKICIVWPSLLGLGERQNQLRNAGDEEDLVSFQGLNFLRNAETPIKQRTQR